MAVSDAAKNAMLNALDESQSAGADFMSLHTGNPGENGASEVTGGSPAYARKGITWGAASGGSKALSAAVTFDIPAGTTVTHIGLWDASSGGNFLIGAALTDSRAFTNQGTLEVTAATMSIPD